MMKNKGLRRPEFKQDNDFEITLWRPKKEYNNQAGDQVSTQVSTQVRKFTLALKGDTCSLSEIQGSLGIRTREYVRKNMIVPAIEAGYLAMRYPDKPNSSNQAYFLTPKGLELLQQLYDK